MEKEVQELQASLKASDADKSPAGEQPSWPDESDAGVSISEHSLERLVADLRSQGGNATPRSIDGVQIDFTTVADLLEEFYSSYHPRFPLLQDPKTCIDSYDTCPLLFWMVMAVGSKNSPTYSHLYLQLQGPVTRLAADHARPASRSIYFVQALLLLSVWPFPFNAVNEEPSWLHCGLAIHMAMLLGLHRPLHPFRLLNAAGAEIGDLPTRTRTWLACFIVDQMTSVRFGLPTTVKPDNTILQALGARSITLPETMESELQIAYIASKYSALLGQYENSSTGLLPAAFPLVRTLDTELNILRTRYSQTWTSATEISFLGARLGLYAYVLAQILPDSTTTSTSTAHPPHEADTEFVTLGSLAATRLLHLAHTSPDDLAKGTQHTAHCVIYAVFFLLRLAFTAPKGLVDETAVHNAVGQTWTLLKSLSRAERDYPARVCMNIEFASRHADWSKEVPLPGKARSLMANNFVADVFIRAREHYAKLHAAAAAAAAAAEEEREGEALAPPAALYADGGGWDQDLLFPMWADFGFDDQEFGALFGGYGLA